MSKASQIVIVDYSAGYYAGVAKTAVPAVRVGKFVQVRHGEIEYLVLSPKELSPYHADILERFCRERSIDGAYQEGKKRFDIRDAEWVVQGGGKYEMDETKRYIRFYDNSMAYGRFESKGLKEKVRGSDMLMDYEVRIE
jgi:hypothetical protein